jgi:hypothetical protein
MNTDKIAPEECFRSGHATLAREPDWPASVQALADARAFLKEWYGRY